MKTNNGKIGVFAMLIFASAIFVGKYDNRNSDISLSNLIELSYANDGENSKGCNEVKYSNYSSDPEDCTLPSGKSGTKTIKYSEKECIGEGNTDCEPYIRATTGPCVES